MVRRYNFFSCHYGKVRINFFNMDMNGQSFQVIVGGVTNAYETEFWLRIVSVIHTCRSLCYGGVCKGRFVLPVHN